MKSLTIIALSAMLTGCATQQEISESQSPPLHVPYSSQEGGLLALFATGMKGKEEQCIELMINDKSWRDLYSYLNAAIDTSPPRHIHIELPAEQGTYIQLLKGLSPADQAVFKKALYRVIPDARRGEKLSPLDLIFISEIHYRIEDYLEHGTPPKPSHWLRRIQLYSETSPSPTNSIPAKQPQQKQ